MTIDDIYTAAVNGDQQQLTALLEADEIDINQMLDGGISAGMHISFPMLFSVLAHMAQNGMNFEILDILVKHGVDLNGKVKVTCEAFTRYIPYIFYAIQDWNCFPMVHYLLDKGAAPDNLKEEYYSEGHEEFYSLTFCAMTCCENASYLQLLLHYGADPDYRCIAYSHQDACNQKLPLLFYSLVDQKSLEKTAMLFSYGADPDVEIDIGIGARPIFKFSRYLSSSYSQFCGLMRQAQQQGAAKPFRPIRAAAPAPAVHGVHPILQSAAEALTHLPKARALQIEERLQPLYQCAKMLIEFDQKHRDRYFAARKVIHSEKPGLFGPSKQYKDAEHDFNLLCERRAEGVKLLNDQDRELTGGKAARWWNVYNGIEHPNVYPDDLMIWLPFKRLVEGPNGLTLCPLLSDEDTIRGKELDLLIRSGELAPVYSEALDPDAEYHIAELCQWSIRDATFVYKTVSKTYDEKEIKAAVQERNQSFNRHEEFLNTLQGKGYFTNEELFLGNQMSSSNFFNSQFLRDQLINDYRTRLENAKTTEVHVQNQEFYHQNFRPIGVIVFDSDYYIQSIQIYQNPKKPERYTMDQNKTIHKIEEAGLSGSREGDRLFALRNLYDYEIPAADLLGEKPPYLSDNEWYEYLYACLDPKGVAQLEIRISVAYQQAGYKKRETIQTARYR